MARLIDVDELKEWIEAWFDMNKYYHPYSKRETIPTVELFDILDRIPTVDLKHGRWEDCSNGWMCSVCKHDARKDYPYCPHCGAEMDGVRE